MPVSPSRLLRWGCIRRVDFLSLLRDNDNMSKQELKQKIREAIERSDFKKDIQKVSLFGSYAYGTPHEGSDIDLLVEFSPTARFGLFKYAGIQYYFEDILGRKVDIVTPTALSKYIRNDVIRLAEPVYGKK